MAKKHKKKVELKKTMEAKGGKYFSDDISSRGKKTIFAGIGLLILGFFVLTCTDPQGRNWASCLAPLLILGAYIIIGWGIFLPDTPEPVPTAPSPQAAPPPAAP